ncbi:alpha/beta hydrolase [Agarivorans sp. QJM3NY_33]|uniref:alpha/beta hydrolase n=1 Tax=Agarivorans sp. QJM3NY_33 TaxID=3421432 RepID=UPI003D7D9943
MPNSATITIEPPHPATHCLIWLHGLGAGPEDFAPLAKHFKFSESIALRYIFPAAPLRTLTVHQGYQLTAWYDILAMQPQRIINQQHLQEVSQQLQLLIEQQMNQGIASQNIVIAGFSQGGAVAYQLALNFPQALGGLLCMSTYLLPASLPSTQQQTNLDILIQHGRQDDVVVPALGEQAHQQLLQQQYNATLEYYEMAHSVSPSQIKAINQWLTQRLQ